MVTRLVPILSKCYIFDPRPRFSFRVVAKRYWIDAFLDNANDTSETEENILTLILIHGVGTHKEQWEPTIQRLFENQKSAVGTSVRFRDMWAIDLLNHGGAAVLNEEALSWGDNTFMSWDCHARGIHAFLCGLGTGVDVDFSKRKLVLIGHSLGAAVATLALSYYPSLKVSSLHLIEPSLMSKQALKDLAAKVSKRAENRREIWSSPEEALQMLKDWYRQQVWDERILKLFIEHGLRPSSPAECLDQKGGFTTKCIKNHEISSYFDFGSLCIGYNLLSYVLKQTPTHIIYGTVVNFIPYEQRQEILHVASGGISYFASVTSVSGAGHMIIQTHPDTVADIIWKSLTQPMRKRFRNSPMAEAVMTKL